MNKRHRLLWLATALAVLAGGLACWATGRTGAHVLTIAAAALFLTGAVYLADVYIPSRQDGKTRCITAVTSGVALCWLLAFYAWEMYAAEHVYVYDDFQFYYQQIVLSANMPYGLGQTLALVRRTIANNDYTYFMNLLVAPLFALTDRTIQSFTLCVTVMTWVPLLYFLRKFALRLGDVLHFDGLRTALLCGAMCIAVCCMPLVHASAIRCQMSLLAMVFFLEVVFLSWGDASWNTSLCRTDWQRRIALFLAAVLLVISRRWYVFLLLGYLLLWGLTTMVTLLRRRDWTGLRHYLLYGAVCGMLGLLLLGGFLRHALQGNYTTAYAYWNKGGFLYELANQVRFNGKAWIILIGLGYVWAFCQKRAKSLRVLALASFLASLFALVGFTRIQNMYHHQSLILVPGYVFGLVMCFAALLTLRKPVCRALAVGTLSLMLVWQFGHCATHAYPATKGGWTSSVPLKPLYRADMDQVRALSDYLSNVTSADRKAFFLGDNELYNRTIFTNVRYPDASLRKTVVMSHYTFRSHGFPEEWFTAGFYVVPDSCQTNHPDGPLEKLRRFVLETVPDRFERVETFSFATADLHVYQRKGPVQADEVDALLTLFAEESAEYPDLFAGRIEKYRPVSP